MRRLLENWKGAVEIAGTQYESVSAIPSNFDFSGCTMIKLVSAKNTSQQEDTKAVYRITVKQYMTKKATPDFTFMRTLNKDNPMPLRTMVGTIENETPGMYYMKLKADTNFEQVQCCMKCGKSITNPISRYFGLGPECGGHNYVNPFSSKEELEETVNAYKKEVLEKIEWEGWVIKSAITEQVEVNETV